MFGDSLPDFDAGASALPCLLPALLELAPPADASRVALPTGMGRLDVRATLKHGRLGLWLATDWLLGVVRKAREAPFPPHEQWDALLSLHVTRAESAWLVAELLAALEPHQAMLGRRVKLGVERRFSERGLHIARLRLRGRPLDGLL